jgi:hypothetical protein
MKGKRSEALMNDLFFSFWFLGEGNAMKTTFFVDSLELSVSRIFGMTYCLQHKICYVGSCIRNVSANIIFRMT